MSSSVTNNSGNTSEQRNFLTDILSSIQGKSETEVENETDALLKSTQQVLQAAPQNAHVQQYLNEQEKTFQNVWNRIPSLYQLSEIDNSRIQTQQTRFLKYTKYINETSRRAIPFLYFITEEVNKRNMPGEIALLPIIESSFNAKAYSRMKAAGLWQFVPATGTYFGLKQNWWYDGRQDVYQSTLAALTYLQQLHTYYKGDWLLALAAYNAGAGNVNKAIRKNLKKGKAIDYWSLPLPKETQKYIPKLLAISRIIAKQNEYNLSLSQIKNEPFLKRIETHSQIDLAVAAKMADISIADIRFYNPAFKQWATDPEGPHHLLIPIDKAQQFKTRLASLDNKDRMQWYRHKIRSGESLYVIARHYKISVAALKQTNHLSSNRIRAGKYLLVPYGTTSTAIVSKKPRTQTKRIQGNSITYKVRKGDSFWTIARRFNMSVNKLTSLNSLSAADTLSIGQSLVIARNKTEKLSQNTSANNKTTEISYKIKSGDSLYTISKQFKVSINDLKRWNDLNTNKYLQPGQQLIVFIVGSQSS